IVTSRACGPVYGFTIATVQGDSSGPILAHNRHSLQSWQKGMHAGEVVKEKKTAAPFVVTFIFIGYASRNTRWDKTETHKASQWLARLYMF
ncbi:hypothetical protein HI565_RS20960, partial [Escherichia coli]